MEEKLDSHLFRTAKVESKLDDHDTRIRDLEIGKARLIVILGALSLTLGGVGSGLGSLLK